MGVLLWLGGVWYPAAAPPAAAASFAPSVVWGLGGGGVGLEWGVPTLLGVLVSRPERVIAIWWDEDEGDASASR